MEPVRRNLLMMGKTGGGKSCLGNSILGRKTFKVSHDTKSETKDVKSDYTEIDGIIVKVVDVPGIMDTDNKNKGEDLEILSSKMAQALAMCDGGVDGFLYVYKYGNRFTGEDREAFVGLKTIFGENFFHHVIVVVTCGDRFVDDMKHDGTSLTFPEWCRRQTGDFRQLVTDCGGRVILFNNREENKHSMKTQVGEILKFANQLCQSKGRYTGEVFQDAKQLREQYICKKQKLSLREDIQEQCGLLMGKLQSYMEKQDDVEKKKITAQINDMKKTIRETDKGYGLLKDLLQLVVEVEKNLKDIVKLHSVVRKLDEVREAKEEWKGFWEDIKPEKDDVATYINPVALVALAGTGLVTGIALAFHSIRERIHEKTKSRLIEKLRKYFTFKK